VSAPRSAVDVAMRAGVVLLTLIAAVIHLPYSARLVEEDK
jgi:hypothetical protein